MHALAVLFVLKFKVIIIASIVAFGIFYYTKFLKKCDNPLLRGGVIQPDVVDPAAYVSFMAAIGPSCISLVYCAIFFVFCFVQIDMPVLVTQLLHIRAISLLMFRHTAHTQVLIHIRDIMIYIQTSHHTTILIITATTVIITITLVAIMIFMSQAMDCHQRHYYQIPIT